MSAWAKPLEVSVETKVSRFVHFAIAKLEAAKGSFENDEDSAEENHLDLCSFCRGMSRSLKFAGAGASLELQTAIGATLEPVWSMRAEEEGPTLREGKFAAVHGALDAVLQLDVIAAAVDEEAAHADVAEHAAPSVVASATKPANLAELSFQDAVDLMWGTLDDAEKRVQWGDDGFTLEMQNKGRGEQDTCTVPLFSSVNLEHPFWQSKVTKCFLALLDNYERETGRAEVVSTTEKREMSAFLDALCATPVMKFALEWLKVHGRDARCATLRASSWKSLLFDLWFAPYRRFKQNDSSGFEHVFVGEESRGKITGLHNWVQYYLEEKKGKIDYMGWTGRQDSDYSDDVNIVTVKFSWADADADIEIKPMSTILCGSTIEFEFALLTMAFLGATQEGATRFTLGSEKIKLTCYPQKSKFGNKIATAYLEIA